MLGRFGIFVYLCRHINKKNIQLYAKIITNTFMLSCISCYICW
jgi:hypothetical protein